MKSLLVVVLSLIAGCASFDGTGPIGGPTAAAYDAAGTARFIQQTEQLLAAS